MGTQSRYRVKRRKQPEEQQTRNSILFSHKTHWYVFSSIPSNKMLTDFVSGKLMNNDFFMTSIYNRYGTIRQTMFSDRTKDPLLRASCTTPLVNECCLTRSWQENTSLLSLVSDERATSLNLSYIYNTNIYRPTAAEVNLRGNFEFTEKKFNNLQQMVYVDPQICYYLVNSSCCVFMFTNTQYHLLKENKEYILELYFSVGLG